MAMENIQVKEKESPWELVRFVLVALFIMVPIRMFVIQPFVVSGSSMFPTFEDKNYLIVDEISYHLGEPDRYDVVIFRYPNDTKKFFIKRIIGLPGETVEIKNETVKIYTGESKEGIVLEETYANFEGDCNTTKMEVRRQLTDNEYFVMGDNRYCSSDSRFWGPVNKDLLIGRALVRLWPMREIDMWPGVYQENDKN